MLQKKLEPQRGVEIKAIFLLGNSVLGETKFNFFNCSTIRESVATNSESKFSTKEYTPICFSNDLR